MMYSQYRIRVILVVCLLSLAFAASAQEHSLRRTPIVQAVEKVGPAVVNISTEQIVRARSQFGFSDPFFDEFFRDFMDPFPRRQYKQNSLGSGVIIDDQGHVLTNHHVILKASKITITLADNREFEAELIGSDARLDLAIVKILSEEHLPVAHMGISTDLMIGEPVIAIGNPFGLSHTITTGVISALNRTIRVSDDTLFQGFIQTDAPINPGNSGGPLINILGDVIGINTAIYGNAQGIGFAIPIDKAKRVIDDLIIFGEVQDVWIGLAIQTMTPDMARYFQHDSADGVLISQVVKESPSDRAGLRQGDILTALDHVPVRQYQEYYTLLREYTPGDPILFSIVRDSKPQELVVTPEEFSTEHAVANIHQDFGMSVDAITPQLARQYRLRADVGVIITDVAKNSPADEVGIRPGDLIRQIGELEIATLTDFRKAVVRVNQDAQVVFLVQRGARGYYITLER